LSFDVDFATVVACRAQNACRRSFDHTTSEDSDALNRRHGGKVDQSWFELRHNVENSFAIVFLDGRKLVEVVDGRITRRKLSQKNDIEMIAYSPNERLRKTATNTYCPLRRRRLKQLHDVFPPD
jgi:hypothetical protein